MDIQSESSQHINAGRPPVQETSRFEMIADFCSEFALNFKRFLAAFLVFGGAAAFLTGIIVGFAVAPPSIGVILMAAGLASVFLGRCSMDLVD